MKKFTGWVLTTLAVGPAFAAPVSASTRIVGAAVVGNEKIHYIDNTQALGQSSAFDVIGANYAAQVDYGFIKLGTAVNTGIIGLRADFSAFASWEDSITVATVEGGSGYIVVPFIVRGSLSPGVGTGRRQTGFEAAVSNDRGRGFSISDYIVGGTEILNVSNDGTPVVTSTGFSTFEARFAFSSGQPLTIRMRASCDSQSDVVPMIVACDLGHSIYWGGISKIELANGGTGTLASVTSASGTNYAHSFAPDAVPEPATWAMFIGGFGLIGAFRRRSPTSVRFA